ncbi:alpha/beta hydrolase family protein [Ramlibacter tataouinensis]|uniref:Esterase-like protein n=1 Tax=Ramlibacter tataouinensis (strain ATCC BAA-407 / DSM 14655 / LMG 21543 / TTB310) TaxID=365046 RepID=F5XZ77_RAMTT|nr:lipase family protein [Ramlibacter tataouinensis]AEG93247.1 esterase-like protein [Ramlibacter tataouinensis TTB310]
MLRNPCRLLALANILAVLLTACGGGGSAGDTGTAGAEAGADAGAVAGRGTLRTAPRTVGELDSDVIDTAAAATGLRGLADRARCDVRIVALDYNTVGVSSEPTNATGVLLVPAGDCAGEAHPLVAYARGTNVQKLDTLAAADDPETLLLATFYAAQGYAVVATDYLGYAGSTYPYHPYLHADSEASAVIDAIRAARAAAPDESLRLSGRVMVSGYSQGGHASAAAQRTMERENAQEFELVAGSHMAGPYNLSGALREPVAVASYPVFMAFLVTSWQKVYGNLYANASQVFRPPYSDNIDNLLPSATLTTSTLVSTGALPGGTPAQAREALLQPAFLSDLLTNDANPVLQAARRNDVLGWSPRARTLLCGGSGDPTVPLATHQAVAAADFASRGVGTVTAVDVDPNIRSAFTLDGQAPTDPESSAYSTYYGNYHAVLQPPFCLARSKALFDSVR